MSSLKYKDAWDSSVRGWEEKTPRRRRRVTRRKRGRPRDPQREPERSSGRGRASHSREGVGSPGDTATLARVPANESASNDAGQTPTGPRGGRSLRAPTPGHSSGHSWAPARCPRAGSRRPPPPAGDPGAAQVRAARAAHTQVFPEGPGRPTCVFSLGIFLPFSLL